MENKPRAKVLLVVLDKELTKAYQTRLESEGFDVVHTSVEESVIEQVIEFDPDVILLDVEVPKTSGLDILQELENTPQTRNTKVIMLTPLPKVQGEQGADFDAKLQIVISDTLERIKHHLNSI